MDMARRRKWMMGGSISNDVPEILIMDILSRLPVKSLLRFRCVSKSWCSSFENPNFYTENRLPSSKKPINRLNQNFLMIYGWRLRQRIMSLFTLEKQQEKVNVKEDENNHTPEFLPNLSLRITDPCNGLLCLQENYFPKYKNQISVPRTITLWNPCIKEIEILPQFTISPPHYTCKYDIEFDSIGFVFDRKSNDYKVIVFVTYIYTRHEYLMKAIIREAHLYSLSRNSWKQITPPPPNFGFGLAYNKAWSPPFNNGNKACSTYIDGICYWGVSSGPVNSILSFDMVDEVYSTISLPDSICELEVHITSIDELVAAIHVLPRKGMEQWYDLWVLLDGCLWIKKLTIGPILGVAIRSSFMRFWKDDALFLFLESDDEELVIFDPYVGELHRCIRMKETNKPLALMLKEYGLASPVHFIDWRGVKSVVEGCPLIRVLVPVVRVRKKKRGKGVERMGMVRQREWMMGGSISNEVPKMLIMDILSRLPLKSLLRFRCVSKSWCSSFENPNFYTNNRLPSSKNPINRLNQNFLLIDGQQASFFTLEKKQGKVDVKEQENNHTPDDLLHNLYFRITDPCNGLLCLQENYFPIIENQIPIQRTLRLWNPCTKEIKILPQITISSPSQYYTASKYYNYSYVIEFDSIGFGFDRKTNDYKVIAFVTYNYTSRHDKLIKAIREAHLYSRSRNSWKQITPPSPDFRFGLPNFPWSPHILVGNKICSTYIDGICYWGVSNDQYGGFILSFDMVEQVYSTISLPNPAFIHKLEVHITSIDEILGCNSCLSKGRD
ncbi:hypothetical protein CCACVL1_01670 [Corchorus capsularis]|uniref:F-box domain-containing protein n=1 Tax=Corchorus capsularis TaxID=210143 RepID=A0A1R3KGJ0_COCAP|nr:hypothetical protein CCACVL1_01670 [Corchorus capsularis]